MQPSSSSIMFGDPADFAIEAGIDGRTTQVWGHMGVWCRGISLGNGKDLHCGMAGAANGFRRLAEHFDDLWDDAFSGLSDHEVWNFLDARLYGCHGTVEPQVGHTLDTLKADAAKYWKFNFLTNWDEMFDGYKAFLLCPPKRAVRILSREFPPNVGLAVEVSRAGVTEAAVSFVRWFDDNNRLLPNRSA
jgi:hypothetical protein